MYIYIDESGSWDHSRKGLHNVFCVGALTIAEEVHTNFEVRFDDLKKQWGYGSNEVKGNKLGERQVMQCLRLLRDCGAILHVSPTDLGCLTDADVSIHQQLQAKQLLNHVTNKHEPSLIEQMESVSQQVASLSPQLYLQFCLTNELIEQLFRDVLIHFALTSPKELENFHWILDAKDQNRTVYETVWHLLLPAAQQDRTLKKGPLIQIQEGDYTHFQKFYQRYDQWPEHVPVPVGVAASEPLEVIDIKRILWDSNKLQHSHACLGLQAVDICVNTFRRALRGKLLWPSWIELGALLLSDGGPAINFFSVTEKKVGELPAVATEFLRAASVLNKQARSVFDKRPHAAAQPV